MLRFGKGGTNDTIKLLSSLTSFLYPDWSSFLSAMISRVLCFADFFCLEQMRHALLVTGLNGTHNGLLRLKRSFNPSVENEVAHCFSLCLRNVWVQAPHKVCGWMSLSSLQISKPKSSSSSIRKSEHRLLLNLTNSFDPKYVVFPHILQRTSSFWKWPAELWSILLNQISVPCIYYVAKFQHPYFSLKSTIGNEKIRHLYTRITRGTTGRTTHDNCKYIFHWKVQSQCLELKQMPGYMSKSNKPVIG